MNKRFVIVVGVFLGSLLGFAVAFLMGERSVGNWLAAPAIILSGLAVLGHLVTLDDDMPSGWSNPGRSGTIWLQSLGQLAIKIAVFVGVLWLFVAVQGRAGV